MYNTSKTVCRILTKLLVEHGVKTVFSSPGSRNAPLIVAASNEEGLTVHPVLDERTAAFMALGYTLVSGAPVALICTSGSAMLNYSPALAEAFYRKLPLIVISADRPLEWIDQDDSQTIHQHGALDNFVKVSYDISDSEKPNDIWYANRLINDALILSNSAPLGPVHINIRLDQPLNKLIPTPKDSVRTISVIKPRADISVSEIRKLASEIASPLKVMVLAGFSAPDHRLNKALNRIACLPNVVVLTETVSNLCGNEFITSIDSVLSVLPDTAKNQMRPDVVITLGGALISRHIKKYLRENPPKEHWHVGINHTTVDALCALTKRIDIKPSIFFPLLASALQPYKSPSTYKTQWHKWKHEAKISHENFINNAPWTDLKAFSILSSLISKDCNLQISNGTSVRYMQLFGDSHFHRTDCNRGVSGIDGSTSTAIGAAMAAYPRATILITGDMSAAYDLTSLSQLKGLDNFRMVVIMNRGGDIFRFIESTSSLPQTPRYLSMDLELPIDKIAAAYEIPFYSADSEQQLLRVFPDFIDPQKGKPAILAIYTPSDSNATILRNYFKRNINPEQ